MTYTTDHGASWFHAGNVPAQTMFAKLRYGVTDRGNGFRWTWDSTWISSQMWSMPMRRFA